MILWTDAQTSHDPHCPARAGLTLPDHGPVCTCDRREAPAPGDGVRAALLAALVVWAAAILATVWWVRS
jgi:hypothetical protein